MFNLRVFLTYGQSSMKFIISQERGSVTKLSFMKV